MAFWHAGQPLVLASSSAIRRTLLAAAHVPLLVRPAAIDERATAESADVHSGIDVAITLAVAKAAAVAAEMPRAIVLGADQTLALGSRVFTKPSGRLAAREQLACLRGRSHELHSAIAVVHGGEVRFRHVATARLRMRDFSDAFLEAYLDDVGDQACASVGGYQLEGPGIHLFEAVDGDYFTILGLPLLPLLRFLREAGFLAA